MPITDLKRNTWEWNKRYQSAVYAQFDEKKIHEFSSKLSYYT